MQDRAPLGPEKLVERVRLDLTQAFGSTTAVTEAAFSHGVVGLMSEHTHYFPGFALLMPIHQGTAVAVRASETGPSRFVVDGSQPHEIGSAADAAGGLLAGILKALDLGAWPLEFAIERTIPQWWREAGLVAMGVAAVRAIQALFALPLDNRILMRHVSQAVAHVLDLPFSPGYALAADAGRPGRYMLVDTAEEETLTLPGADTHALSWGAVHLDGDDERTRRTVREQVTLADRALDVLRRHGFPGLTSYRELEHRDLERALDVLSGRLAGVVRYLVTENRRVQKMVAAVRRGDWQLLGAFMLMSHAVQREDWGMTTLAADHVVAQVESMTIEGLYGARSTGRNNTVLLAGQTFVVPDFLDRITDDVRRRFGQSAESLLL